MNISIKQIQLFGYPKNVYAELFMWSETPLKFTEEKLKRIDEIINSDELSTEKFMNALKLRFKSQMTYKEIGEELNVVESRANQLVNKGLILLRYRLTHDRNRSDTPIKTDDVEEKPKITDFEDVYFKSILESEIDELRIPVWVCNALHRFKIYTVQDFVNLYFSKPRLTIMGNQTFKSPEEFTANDANILHIRNFGKVAYKYVYWGFHLNELNEYYKAYHK